MRKAGTDPRLLASVLDALPDGVVSFDDEWTVRYVNRSGARLLRRNRDELVGRNIWIALPELAGTIFHSFLLHARSADDRVTWRGYYAPVAEWLEATAVKDGDTLHMTFRAAAGTVREGDPADADGHDAGVDEGDNSRLRFLAEVSDAMIGSLDTRESVGRLMDLVVPRLCDWATVTVLGYDGQPADLGRAHADPRLLADLDTYLLERTRRGGDDSLVTAALITGEPVHVDRIDPAMVEGSMPSEEVRSAWRRLDPASFTMVPLRARDETFGVLSLVNSSARPPHDEMDIATAVEVARRAALSLDNARLYGRQLQVAETLQRSLLTPPPQPEHLQIAVRYQPAGTNMHVGGDWYDAFQQRDGATLLVIGDVVGHNVDAAAAMGQIRSMVRGIAYDRQESPAQILGRVDEVMTGLRIGTLATALVARIEQPADQAAEGSRTLRWSSAGHLPPLLLHPDGSVEVLDSAPQILLGAESTVPRTDQEVLIGPGQTLVLYTDGLVEHGRAGIDEGTSRLVGLAGELGDLGVDEFCDQVLERIVRQRSDDDVALLVVRFGPEGLRGSSATSDPREGPAPHR
ncbi:MAG TPA: SpoIIE family protein phosphatase [Blastococcus sp.]|nr:SpoIIE family protein phosphatase [Blastococcus sp.]